jgi:hypothetical protein
MTPHTRTKRLRAAVIAPAVSRDEPRTPVIVPAAADVRSASAGIDPAYPNEVRRTRR